MKVLNSNCQNLWSRKHFVKKWERMRYWKLKNLNLQKFLICGNGNSKCLLIMLSNLKVLKNVVLGYIYKWLIDCKVFVIPSLSPNPNINSKLIVSMTSYGRRVEKSVVYYSLVSILRQTVKPDRIILLPRWIKWNVEKFA